MRIEAFAIWSNEGQATLAIAGSNLTGVDTAYSRALRPALIRWGGNQTTRYNWRIGHAWNTGSDYFYHNTDFGVHTGSAADAMAAQANAAGATMLFTIPTIGWVAKDTTSFSFPGPKGQPTNG